MFALSSPADRGRLLVLTGALLASALTFGFGVAPASADTNPVAPDGLSRSDLAASHSITLHIQRQTSLRGKIVMSVGVQKVGATGAVQCLTFPGPIPDLDKPGLHYTSSDLRVSTPGQYNVFSYGDSHCPDNAFLVGTRGTIDPYRWQSWTVYANRPPKLNL